MRRPARAMVSGQVAAFASDREFPASTGHATGTSSASMPNVSLGAPVSRFLMALGCQVRSLWADVAVRP
jgi:hypothetical protein